MNDLRRAVRDLIHRLSFGAGLFGGLFWALDQPTATPAACDTSRGARDDGIGECLNEALRATGMPYLEGMLVGALIGAVAGLLLTRRLVPAPNRG